VAIVPDQFLGGGGHTGAGSELPRLDRRAVGQLSAGYSGREFEVILDQRGRRCLPADSHGIHNNRGQALRRTVDGRSQSGRTRADDEQIAGRLAARCGGQPDQLGQLGITRVTQHPVPPHDDGGVLGPDAQLTQQVLRGRVALQVDETVRQPVAHREIAQPSSVLRVPRADDAKANPEPDRQRPADQAGAQDVITERRLSRDDRAQPRHAHDKHLTVLQRHRREELGLPGEHAQLAQEPPGAVHPDHPLLVRAVCLDHRDPTGEHDIERLTPIALDEHHLA